MKIFQSIYTTCFVTWSDLVAIARVLSLKNFLEINRGAFIFSKLQTNENIQGSFPLLVTLKADFWKIALLKLSKKISLQPISIAYRVLERSTLQKKLPQVSFLGIFRANTLPHNFWAAILLWSSSCKKSLLNHYYKEWIIRFPTKKHFIKNLLKVNKEMRLNQIMSELITLSQCLQLNCKQIQQLFAFLHYVLDMLNILTVHSSHTTRGIIL